MQDEKLFKTIFDNCTHSFIDEMLLTFSQEEFSEWLDIDPSNNKIQHLINLQIVKNRLIALEYYHLLPILDLKIDKLSKS
jgi:hypothetical protein